jgi:hypothetical protein
MLSTTSPTSLPLMVTGLKAESRQSGKSWARLSIEWVAASAKSVRISNKATQVQALV